MQAPADPISILLVDDSPIVLKFASRVLRSLEQPVITAENGMAAVKQLESEPADIVVTDIMMPEMDGFELISRIRSDERLTQSHIIVMTALEKVEDKVRALSLGANDYTVKPLDASELRARVEAGIRECRLKKELTAALRSLDHELTMVGRLQRRLLPKSMPDLPGFSAAVSYQPCTRAGGDYYDCFLDGRGRLVVVVADVSGHGASAAVLMGMFRALLKVQIERGNSAAAVVDLLNEALLENIGDDPDFISVFLGLVDPATRRFNYCAAGHGDMILMGPGPGELERLPAGGTVLGCFPGHWEDAEIQLQRDQRLVLYTDGLIEAVNSRDEEYGRDRLEDTLSGLDTDVPPAGMVERVREEVALFTEGTSFADDVTLFVARFQ